MRELANRIARLERASPDHDAAGAELTFWQAARTIGRSWQPEAGNMTLGERVNQLTPLQHMGWALRFSETPELADVLRHHGKAVPTNFLGWVLLHAWIPGDDEP